MRDSSDHRSRMLKFVGLRGVFVIAPIVLALIVSTPKAGATPAFARQTGKTCSFCHRGPPRLNDTGLAFKNNGFLLPDSSKVPNKDLKDTPAQ